ncbi:hypothetical protein [Aliiroseovarius sp.]|uniref:hypothetical protein n=1 Tax=Aliiroseovarius sp. TaxID=1872442 RepID=UPI002604010A|nr:hypothetical protein [Aliiroseovarius sp.]
MNFKTGFLAAALLAGPAMAQQFTSAAEVKPMLSATKDRWVAVREYDGRDLLYFTNLLAWRCGMDRIFYTVNGGAETALDAEPCYRDEAVPNAQKADGYLPFLSFPLGSVNDVSVRVIYDDGSEDGGAYQRGSILIQ